MLVCPQCLAQSSRDPVTSGVTGAQECPELNGVTLGAFWVGEGHQQDKPQEKLVISAPPESSREERGSAGGGAGN